MKLEVKVPSPGESITQVQLANWLVENGDFVEKDQEIVEIDSDKATLSISAETDGKINILIEAGETIEVGTVIATIDAEAKSSYAKPARAGGASKARSSSAKASEDKSDLEKSTGNKEVKESSKAESISSEDESSSSAETTSNDKETKIESSFAKASEDKTLHISPLAQKLMQQQNISEAELIDFFKSVRVGKKDIEFYLDKKDEIKSAPAVTSSWGGSRTNKRSKMSTLRLKLAERLVSVKNGTAMLTTFNEVNMTPIMDIRKKYKEQFKEKHGVGLGFMSFFTKAITEALPYFPQINSMIDGDEIVSFDYADIGIAVSAPKGLVVPVIRNAETLSLSQIEHSIKDLADKARNNKITLDDMKGGTFTITNGGVFGSMLSTPIINPPQSAILGMHNIVERPIAVNGKVEIHPIMYVALSYDHRIVDGKDSVGFLVKVKELLENPVQLLFSGHDPLTKLLDI